MMFGQSGRAGLGVRAALLGAGCLSAVVATSGVSAVAATQSTARPAVASPSKCGRNPAHNSHLTRATMQQRGKSWLGKVWYSESSYYCNQYGRYRQDCSGYVSMAWGLSTSYWTGTLVNVSKRIKRSQLRPGDALIHNPQSTATGHVAMFIKWANKAHTEPVVWEESHTGTKAGQTTWSVSYANTFYPIRYKNVK